MAKYAIIWDSADSTTKKVEVSAFNSSTEPTDLGSSLSSDGKIATITSSTGTNTSIDLFDSLNKIAQSLPVSDLS